MTLSLILTATGAGLSGLSLWIHFVSRRENEFTAARRSLGAAFLLPAMFVLVAWTPIPGRGVIGTVLLAVAAATAIALVVPFERSAVSPTPDPPGRVDERTIMFSRAGLDPGTPRFENYYAAYPAHRDPDDRFRELPGLMDKRSGKYEPVSFAAAEASFETVGRLAGMIEGEPAVERTDLDPVAATAFVKGWTKRLGALECGVATLKDHHVYSIKGRGPRYGETIDIEDDLDHPYAIAFTVEMDHRQMAAAPEGPTLMESAQQYLASGAIAVQLAAGLRNLGWRAEAHIDGNYRVICPLVARDAGLGEIGRMGLLMTPRLGPRVRIAVVTTDLPLVPDARRPSPDVLHFCGICRKCADVCPPAAIPASDPTEYEGVSRWRIDQEACFTYWCAVGTDCGRCMRVCPYAHPDAALHNLVRWGLRRSWLFRHVALRLDDLLYGRRPAPIDPPDWLPTRARPGNQRSSAPFDDPGSRA